MGNGKGSGEGEAEFRRGRSTNMDIFRQEWILDPFHSVHLRIVVQRALGTDETYTGIEMPSM